MRNSIRFSLTLMTLAVGALVSACGGGNDAPAASSMATFEVTLTNLTAGQPLSPMVAIAHDAGFSAFSVGEVASAELERLAEGGASAPLADLANASKSVFATSIGQALPPGPKSRSTVTLSVPVANLPTLLFSLAAMLGNTNDGFTGVSGQPLATLAVGETVNTELLSYDAGTERNTESADTVPGPATSGSGGSREGFNAARDDFVSTVHLHPGVVSADDGLLTSALKQVNRWDNPAAMLSIKRTQ